MTGTVLVTGGAGYIGAHACKALAETGYLPVTYDNLSIGGRWSVRRDPLEIGDIRDGVQLGTVLRRHRLVGVLHFAALALVGETLADRGLYSRVNMGGAQAVMDATLAAGPGRRPSCSGPTARSTARRRGCRSPWRRRRRRSNPPAP